MQAVGSVSILFVERMSGSSVMLGVDCVGVLWARTWRSAHPAMVSHNNKSLLQFGCLIALALYSASVAFTFYPFGAWRFGAGFAAVAFVSLFLRVGWIVPCTIAGTYVGMFLDARVKGGTKESQILETVTAVTLGAVCGLVIGGLIDAWRRSKSDTQGADEQTDAREPG